MLGSRLLVLTLLLSSILVLGSVFGHGRCRPAEAPQLWVSSRLIAGASIVAGLVGSLVGLGGGVLVVPLLTLAFAVSPEIAVGVSIVSVIATSSGAAAAYVKDHITNLRVGMFLEIATTIGAIAGAFLATVIAPGWLFIIFGVVLLISARAADHQDRRGDSRRRHQRPLGEQARARLELSRREAWPHHRVSGDARARRASA